MKLATYLSIAGAVAMLFGLEFLLAPGFALAQYGVPTEPHNLLQSRYFGGALFAFGLLMWLARRTTDETALGAILLAGIVGNLLGAAVSVWAAVSGLQNAMAWSSVAIYLLFAAGNLYYLSSSARRAPEAA
jgi:hypothetical protein